MREFIWGRYALWAYTGFAAIIFAGLSTLIHSYFLTGVVLSTLIFGLGCYDFFQKKRGLLANYPLLGRARYMLESIRPELRQYFWEADTDELPYSVINELWSISAQEVFWQPDLSALCLTLMQRITVG